MHFLLRIIRAMARLLEWTISLRAVRGEIKKNSKFLKTLPRPTTFQFQHSGANSLVKALLSSASSAFQSNNHHASANHASLQHLAGGSQAAPAALGSNGAGPSSPRQPKAATEPDRPIGYGAFGVVWSVTDPRDHKRVALKKMPNVFQNLASCKRVFRELRMLASFQHDNVRENGF